MKGITVPSQRLTPKEAAEILSIKPVTIYNYIRLGKIRAYRKNNGQIYFNRDDIDEYKSRYEKPIVPIVPKNEPINGKDIGLKTIKGYLMTVKEVADFLGVDPRWIEKHMANGTFPIKYLPLSERHRRIDSADLDKLVSKIMIEAGEAPLPLKTAKRIIRMAERKNKMRKAKITKRRNVGRKEAAMK